VTVGDSTTGERRASAAPDSQTVIGVAIVLAALLWLFWSADFAWIIVVTVLARAGVYAVSAMGLNLQFGYTGLLQFGQVGFMIIGAYTFALLIPHELGRAASQGGNWPVWLAMIAAMLGAALLGLILGVPTVRLRGDYLAIVTIAVAEILRIATQSFDFFGTSFGVIQYGAAFDAWRPGWVTSLSERISVPPAKLWVFIFIWICVIIVLVLLALAIRSPWGRVLRAIREDEDAARALGKNAFWYKLQSLMIGGAIGGLAGVLLALENTTINPPAFLPLVTFFAWAAMIIGGAGTLTGPIAGSIIFWIVLTQTSDLATDVFPGWSSQAIAGTRFVLMGALLMAVMIFRPQGLFGKREELSLEIQ
jgi:branched-chain amino acid transport system permease protein